MLPHLLWQSRSENLTFSTSALPFASFRAGTIVTSIIICSLKNMVRWMSARWLHILNILLDYRQQLRLIVRLNFVPQQGMECIFLCKSVHVLFYLLLHSCSKKHSMTHQPPPQFILTSTQWGRLGRSGRELHHRMSSGFPSLVHYITLH